MNRIALAFSASLLLLNGARAEDLVIGPAGKAAIATEPSAALKAAREVERGYVETIKKVLPAYVFIEGGSGVLISADGYVLTNHHVVRDQKLLLVRNNDREYYAVTTGIDPQGDIALLKLKEYKSTQTAPTRKSQRSNPAALKSFLAELKDVSNMPHLEFADSDSLSVGQQVLAIGNPFDTAEGIGDPTVTTGIISALHRFESNYSDAIQTDASINPGNSGGPLVTMEGKLAGINGLIETRYGNAANSGVALAIPSKQIERFVPKLKVANGGEIKHGFVAGIKIGEDMDYEGLRNGAELKRVVPDSPADKLGLKAGDKIIKVENYPLLNVARLVGVLSSFPAGTEVKITYQRGNEVKTVQAKLDNYKPRDIADLGENPRFGNPEEPGQKVTKGKLGISIKDGAVQDPKVNRNPAVISKIDDNSAAQKAGLEIGDQIVSINGEPIKNIHLFKMVMRKGGFQAGEKLAMVVLRGEGGSVKEIHTTVTLE